MGTPGRGYALDAGEFEQLKASLRAAGEALGLQDFHAKASLEGSMTVQSVSPHENIEETVDGVIRALTKFVDQVHTTIETAIDGVHRTQ
ncbi:hypothetical protein [Saccharothrix syringae]|uniref:Uncharacterized protein n=1 Tax=Saccharothrix syringae TaxID=103733 RepID=A0A5Q0GU88_SACSY|nr:hypothetical protein [Saccharothrix syringae]QFZ16932.1 hypothetical protein EKG83_05125 [Saccharothrix syringae]